MGEQEKNAPMTDSDSSTGATSALASETAVRHFRQILMWPLRIMPGQLEGTRIPKHWEAIEVAADACPWQELRDEFDDPKSFQQRHYKEFITFLPFVQRCLYGQGSASSPRGGLDSALRVFRRRDIAQMRVTLERDQVPWVLQIAHVDLYFFFDTDIIIPVVEVFADDVPLLVAEDLLFKTGRAYPAYWKPDGRAAQCPYRVEWLSPTGDILAVSDYEDQQKFLEFTCQHRSPNVAAHWAYLLEPLALHLSDCGGVIRFRQIEYHRMPLLAYLSFDDPKALTRGDFARLALITKAGPSESLPYSTRELATLEERHCYDRFWDPLEPDLSCRYLCCGHAFVVVGKAADDFFADQETGVLGQFRHQYFLMNLMAHFQKAALMLFSEWLVAAISQLEVQDVDSIKAFKREIRQLLASFLRFTERYWFHVVSAQVQARDLFRLLSRHLDTDQLYHDVSASIKDMNQYLDSDSLRRQANTVVRLTVVTTLGLIATVSTGFLGMNIFDEADNPVWIKLLILLVVFIPSTLLVNYAVANSKVLSDFLEALADKRLSWWDRTQVLFRVWRNPPPRAANPASLSGQANLGGRGDNGSGQ